VTVGSAPAASEYTTGDVAHLIGITPGQIRAIARSGVLEPHRGPRNVYLFSFRDLVLLRTAGGLLRAHVTPARIVRALQRLHTQLPEGRTLTELHIRADGDDVVVHDGGTAWDPITGQCVFDFAVADLATQVASLTTRRTAADVFEDGQAPGAADDVDSAATWVQRGIELEAESPAEAEQAYRRAVALEPDHADAHINLGRLLHEAGRTEEAALHYRRALAARPDHATAWFNLGVALEDLRRPDDARAAYEHAVRFHTGFADAHYNLASLYERRGDRRAALRHLRAHRELTERGSDGIV
jgi:tetratricopeptide (TPR) repeat protein